LRISTAGLAERNGRYLVALRRPGTSIGEKWEFPGGKVHAGEDPAGALSREFREELEVEIIVGDCVCTGSFYNNETEYELQAYEVRLLSESFQLKEHQQLKWCSLTELGELSMADSDRLILRCLLDNTKKAK
jgi:8-oxo-dGTP diphosphatase